MKSFDGGHSDYYCQGGIEAMDVIEAFGLNFALGSAIKYILRFGKKGNNEDSIRDLEKARAYIDREITRLKALEEMPKSDLHGLARYESE
jgi:hypothetical protein